ncbi:MAG: hypothetical protein KatS3mg111_0696 [Pirellulaceae bacterium]|nr:MAG: hypothetical protein KatS3mg111_0696 [Pirellulaceae bacterium]
MTLVANYRHVAPRQKSETARGETFEVGSAQALTLCRGAGA